MSRTLLVLIPELRSYLRVGGDSAWVIVRSADHQTWSQLAEETATERREAAASRGYS